MIEELSTGGGDLPSPAVVLMVCSANVCRSPVAEHHLRRTLEQRGFTSLAVASAGVDGMTGRPIDPVMAKLLDRDGISSVDFRARRLVAADVAGATLILTAERAHKSKIVRESPKTLSKTFTLLEFVALASASKTDRSAGVTEHLRSLMHGAVTQRPYASLRGKALDIQDPHSQSTAQYRRAYAQLRSACSTLAMLL